MRRASIALGLASILAHAAPLWAAVPTEGGASAKVPAPTEGAASAKAPAATEDGASAQAPTEGRALAQGPAPDVAPSPPSSDGWRWRRVSEGDYATAGLLVASLSGAAIGLRPAPHGRRGGIFFDDALRRTLRADSEVGRERADVFSSIGQDILVTFPYAVDAGLLGLMQPAGSDAAFQMFVINTESFLLTALVTMVTKNVVSRERPYVQDCADRGCASASRNKSFISGHAAASFTGAGLVCAHHESLGLFGDAVRDHATCAGALALASTTSVLRVISDQHYATDVLAGAAVGFLSGYVFPMLVHYVSPDD